ncbi:hypothetical protein [Janthinobacterium sp. PAMC25594]|nr:hypothetical protein [Janthinobacterium sp. PAMC25594]QYG07149.1 hypothetical protein KY494_28875 [Janthinobacterium sp. PAMC25594]
MIAFIVTVRRDGLPVLSYPHQACDGSTAIMNAQDKYGICRVSVKPA